MMSFVIHFSESIVVKRPHRVLTFYYLIITTTVIHLCVSSVIELGIGIRIIRLIFPLEIKMVRQLNFLQKKLPIKNSSRKYTSLIGGGGGAVSCKNPPLPIMTTMQCKK